MTIQEFAQTSGVVTPLKLWKSQHEFIGEELLPIKEPAENPVHEHGEKLFERQSDGTYQESGECRTLHGRFQWLRDDGRWEGGWSIEPIADLLARMNQTGPYKYSAYRILPAEEPELVIKPTCASCGVIAGVDCQRACEYVFGRADVSESLPIQFNGDHQFSLSVSVVTDGKHFGNRKPKTFWFNSVRCAELFLMDQGLALKGASTQVGSGERLLGYLGGPEVIKSRKKLSRSSLEYKQVQMRKTSGRATAIFHAVAY